MSWEPKCYGEESHGAVFAKGQGMKNTDFPQDMASVVTSQVQRISSLSLLYVLVRVNHCEIRVPVLPYELPFGEHMHREGVFIWDGISYDFTATSEKGTLLLSRITQNCFEDFSALFLRMKSFLWRAWLSG